MAATIADNATPGASVAAAATEGRKACMFSAVMRTSLLACGDFGAGLPGLETRSNGRRDLRRRIDNDDAGCFQRAPFGAVAAGISGNDGAGMAHFLSRRRRCAGDEGH